jgi:predicted ATPase with chaperone activity
VRAALAEQADRAPAFTPMARRGVERLGVRAWSHIERIATVVALLDGRDLVVEADVAEALHLHGDHW